MEVLATLPPRLPLREVGAAVARVERLGFDTIHIAETVHDSLMVSTLALEHTTSLTVATSMTIAFPRSPMITALAAWDLSAASGGRFQLGLGTQVRGNIEGRFSATWDRPAAHLADYVAAVRAIFAAFAAGGGSGSLEHHGSHYDFTRLQPYFTPDPLPAGVAAPPIYAGAVGPLMLAVVGRHVDGFVAHPTHSHPAWLRELGLPAIGAAASAAGRPLPRIVAVPKPVTGADLAALAQAREHARQELAFLYSTPAYRPMLDLLGHGELSPRLTALVRDEAWDRLVDVLSDEVLADLTVQATWEHLPQALAGRYAGLVDGLVIPLPDPADGIDDARIAAVVEAVAAIPTRSETLEVS